jgi:hypothetical protein
MNYNFKEPINDFDDIEAFEDDVTDGFLSEDFDEDDNCYDF